MPCVHPRVDQHVDYGLVRSVAAPYLLRRAILVGAWRSQRGAACMTNGPQSLAGGRVPILFSCAPSGPSCGRWPRSTIPFGSKVPRSSRRARRSSPGTTACSVTSLRSSSSGCSLRADVFLSASRIAGSSACRSFAISSSAWAEPTAAPLVRSERSSEAILSCVTPGARARCSSTSVTSIVCSGRKALGSRGSRSRARSRSCRSRRPASTTPSTSTASSGGADSGGARNGDDQRLQGDGGE